nr:MAG TPA: hypothetical protein [Caudoviricetes sp.]
MYQDKPREVVHLTGLFFWFISEVRGTRPSEMNLLFR